MNRERFTVLALCEFKSLCCPPSSSCVSSHRIWHCFLTHRAVSCLPWSTTKTNSNLVHNINQLYCYETLIHPNIMEWCILTQKCLQSYSFQHIFQYRVLIFEIITWNFSQLLLSFSVLDPANISLFNHSLFFGSQYYFECYAVGTVLSIESKVGKDRWFSSLSPQPCNRYKH